MDDVEVIGRSVKELIKKMCKVLLRLIERKFFFVEYSSYSLPSGSSGTAALPRDGHLTQPRVCA